MGKHRWPTAGDAGAPPRRTLPPDGPDGDAGDGHSPVNGDDGEPPHPGGVQWRVARSAALVFLGVALAVGAALFLVRSSEPSAAAVSVQLDARPTGPDGDGASDSGSRSTAGGTGGADRNAAEEDPSRAEGSSSDGSSLQGGRGGPAAVAGTGAGEGPVIVYVTGAVATPGVITVPAGTRLVEIIERAGGALPEADLEGINLAGIPTDGQHIHLLAVGEEPRPGVGEPPVPAPASGPGPRTGPEAGGADGASPGIIDINTATLAQIETLPGVGPVLGQRIIDWRDEHGPFAQAADVDAVPGIGPALLEGMLPLVTVR
ncbi:ComEA family DNA-binding protein [Arthrobacter sp. L77]|uniref:ComEA family DNA-binding protein n=1 Tax=Arthrobacter sp. L77 TaxID=1496689 RepID=UPI0012E07C24|nr:ComEA family DNA-binding protein [Arthrobacter sp. L77]